MGADAGRRLGRRVPGRAARAGGITAAFARCRGVTGEQLSGLLLTFTVTDGTTAVPGEVEAVSMGEGRIEADLEAFAIGGQIPDDVLRFPLSVLGERVSTGGRSRQV